MSANTISPVVGVFGEERLEVRYPNQWSSVTGQRNDRTSAEDGVDGTALWAELAQVRSAKQSIRPLKKLNR
jgi:hypothetical protein